MEPWYKWSVHMPEEHGDLVRFQEVPPLDILYRYYRIESIMIKRNQLGVLFNAYQGNHRKVLTVCSAGCLRSPTAAHILSSPPWNFNTRCAGTSEEYAIVPVTEALVAWADVILVMDEHQQRHINEMQNKLAEGFGSMYGGMYAEFDYKPVINLEIEDNYDYRNPQLVEIMTNKFKELFPIEE